MGAGRAVAGLAVGLGAAAAAGRAAVARAAGAVRSHDDPVPYEVLRQEPEGERLWLERPDGTRLHAIVAGEGPLVVLTHGYASSVVAFNLLMPRLVEEGHRVVALDWRGHGRTTVGSDGITPELVAADHAALLEHLDARDAVLVGHSTGGYISIAMLLGHPDATARLAGFVLMASLAGDAAVDAPQTRLQIPLITSGVMQRIAAHDDLGMLFGASIWGPDPWPAALRVFLDVFAEADHEALVPLLERLAHTGFYDRLGEITVPTVVVCGEEDATTPRWHSEAMGRDIPDARNVWVPNAGHALNWQSPETIVAAIRDLHTGAGRPAV